MAILEPRSITLATGEICTVRSAAPDDADALVAVMLGVLREAPFTVTTAAEFEATAANERKWIEDHAAKPGWLALVPVVGGDVVGCLSFENTERERQAHRGSFGISIAAPWRGRGIGHALIGALLEWATAHATIEKVSLAVIEGNVRAMALYRSLGFVEEGRRPKHVRYGPGHYAGDVLMYRFVK